MNLPVSTIECKAVADPELRFTQQGKPVMNLRTVCSDRRKNEQTQQWEDSATLWLDVTAWDALAENSVESIQKGDDLIIIGKLKTEEWEDKESGAKRQKTVLTAFSIGRSMRWHPVPHGARTERTTPATQPAATGSNDPWSQAAPPQPDEPPF